MIIIYNLKSIIQNPLRRYLIVGSGGAAGAVSRYELGGLFKVGPGDFPLGTFLINLTGCLVLGFFLTLIAERYRLRAEWRLLVATGFVGAYTTFSSFSNEVLTLFRQGFVAMGLLYSAGSLVGGLLAVTAGMALARLVAFGRLSPPPDEPPKSDVTNRLPTEERLELDQD